MRRIARSVVLPTSNASPRAVRYPDVYKSQKNDSVYAVSALLSVKPCEVAGAVERLLAETVALRQRVDSLQGEILSARVAGQAPEG